MGSGVDAITLGKFIIGHPKAVLLFRFISVSFSFSVCIFLCYLPTDFISAFFSF